MSECNCIKAENTRVTLRKTFEFIQLYQVTSIGTLVYTTIFININLLQTQVSGNLQDRVSASNTISGFISAVTDTNIVVIAPSELKNQYSEYTIEYSTIIQVASPSITSHYNLYVKYMDTIPPVCSLGDDQYTKMLNLFKILINYYENHGFKGFQIIFNGVKSRLISFLDLDIVKNLIIIGNLYIIPLNYIGGFTMIPNCENRDNLTIKEEEK